MSAHFYNQDTFFYPLHSFMAKPRWPYLAKMALSVGLARTIYIRCIYGVFGREITKYTVIYIAYIRFWPTLLIKCT